MRKEEFTFDSRDGKTKIYACAFYPETEPICILQIVHGMNEHIARYEEFARYLTDRGIIVVGNDHLGHGKTVKEGETFGYFCENDPSTVLVRDVHRLKKMMEETYPALPYIIFGHSMGSFILRNYIGRYGTGVEGVILAGTGTPTLPEILFGKSVTTVISKMRGTKYVSKFTKYITTGNYMSGIKNAKTEHDWLTTDEDEIEKYTNDVLCCGYTFTLNGYHTLFELALRMQKKENLRNIPKKLPILIVSGTEDPVGKMGIGPKKLYDNFLNLDLTKTALKLYSGARHEVLNEVNREIVYTDIFNWIERIAMEDLKK